MKKYFSALRKTNNILFIGPTLMFPSAVNSSVIIYSSACGFKNPYDFLYAVENKR